MIGSHDTFTYLDSTSFIKNHCKKLWRCQGQSIENQYKFGIRFFDIRVSKDDNKWRVCHGAVNLKKTFRTLTDICDYMNQNFPEAIYRIVLEKGANNKFYKEAKGLCSKYPNLWRIDEKATKKWMGVIENNNQALYDRGYKFALVNTWENPAHELHGNMSAGNILKIDLRKEAKKINGKLSFFKKDADLKQMIESKDELYLLDYCTNKY